MTDEEYYKIVDRIKLLSKMTVKNGCSPQEAATAHDLSEELRAKLHDRNLKDAKEHGRLTIEAWKKIQKKWFTELRMDQHVGNYVVEPDNGYFKVKRKGE